MLPATGGFIHIPAEKAFPEDKAETINMNEPVSP